MYGKPDYQGTKNMGHVSSAEAEGWRPNNDGKMPCEGRAQVQVKFADGTTMHGQAFNINWLPVKLWRYYDFSSKL